MESTIDGTFYTRKEAAAYLKKRLGFCTPKTLAFWACKKKDKLKVHKLGGYRVRYLKSDLDAFIREVRKKLFSP